MATVSANHLLPAPAVPVSSGAPARVLPLPNGYELAFAVFIVTNAVLFIRPSEFVTAVEGLELYVLLILPCLALAFPTILAQLSARSLERMPATVCVLGLLGMVMLSHLAHMQVELAVEKGVMFAKVTAYYLLCVGLVTTPARLRTFFWWLPLFCTFIAILTVLHYHKVIVLPTNTQVKEMIFDPALGKDVPFNRLTGTGIFADPNEFCVLMALCLILGIYWLTDPRSGVLGLLWLLPMGICFYAMTLTYSRGGLLAFLAALIVFFRARFGTLMTILLGGAGLPLLLLVVGGRQATISLGSSTGQTRLEIWADAFESFKSSPLFGIGCDEMAKDGGFVAHNSYLHAFVELGLPGGILFFGAFGYSLFQLVKLGTKRVIRDPVESRLLTYVTALLAGYMVGMMSLTLTYVIPTYTMLGIATVFLGMTTSEPPLPEKRFDAGWLVTWSFLALSLMVALNLLVKMFLVR